MTMSVFYGHPVRHPLVHSCFETVKPPVSDLKKAELRVFRVTWL